MTASLEDNMCIVAMWFRCYTKKKKSDMKQKMCHATIRMEGWVWLKKKKCPRLPVTPPAERNWMKGGGGWGIQSSVWPAQTRVHITLPQVRFHMLSTSCSTLQPGSASNGCALRQSHRWDIEEIQLDVRSGSLQEKVTLSLCNRAFISIPTAIFVW